MRLIYIKFILALLLRYAVSQEVVIDMSDYFDHHLDVRQQSVTSSNRNDDAVVGLFSSSKYKCPVNHCKFGSCVNVTRALKDGTVTTNMTFPNNIDDFNNALMCYCPYNYEGKRCENCEFFLDAVQKM